jgi:hypothetical protein
MAAEAAGDFTVEAGVASTAVEAGLAAGGIPPPAVMAAATTVAITAGIVADTAAMEMAHTGDMEIAALAAALLIRMDAAAILMGIVAPMEAMGLMDRGIQAIPAA